VATPGDLKPEQDVSGPGLTRHLYEHSRWIEDYLTFAKEPSGETPEIILGEWCRLFSDEEVRIFSRELARIPEPADPETRREFINLRAIVRASAENQQFGLLISVF
jgi:hypothetical protein